ncbi:MAG: prepilin-type N-terminal cleavage/methylation domain-containing protein [Cellvibrionaceae bacterium]|nr:prepilin-type N-terminal cleavage/methylation domain-containing protein [Cellvibrionaceae bacterium]
MCTQNKCKGFSLLELVVFMVVMSVAAVGLLTLYRQLLLTVSAPVVNSQLLFLTQSQLAIILSRKFDENTPAGGVPSCARLAVCAGIGLEAGESFKHLASLDDIDDFDGYRHSPMPGYHVQARVRYAGDVFALPRTEVKYIWVEAQGPDNQRLQLSAYRTNY